MLDRERRRRRIADIELKVIGTGEKGLLVAPKEGVKEMVAGLIRHQLQRLFCRHFNSSLRECYDCGKVFELPAWVSTTSEFVRQSRLEAQRRLQQIQQKRRNVPAANLIEFKSWTAQSKSERRASA